MKLRKLKKISKKERKKEDKASQDIKWSKEKINDILWKNIRYLWLLFQSCNHSEFINQKNVISDNELIIIIYYRYITYSFL